ncbi:MAG: sporulation protein YunB [Clostridia bacterium]|nr:sporulation protein YunB [Clostridia bacterium]
MKRIRKKLIASMLLLLVLFTGAFIYVNRSLRPVLEGLSKARVESVAAAAMNDAVLQILSREDNTGDLITIHEANGAVYYLEADSSKLNTLAADCAICAQEKIASLGEQGVSIPIGTVSGIPLFTGMGPNLVMKFTPAGAVQSTFSSKFTSAGINQTLHRITLTLKATVRIILPGDAYIVSIETQAPISESILVGSVPSTYTDVTQEDMLDLIPD